MFDVGLLSRCIQHQRRANQSQKIMLYRLISRLHQIGLVQGTSLARWLRILSRTRVRLYQSSLISPHHRRTEHLLLNVEDEDAWVAGAHWHPPELTEYWVLRFRRAKDRDAWQEVLFNYERRN